MCHTCGRACTLGSADWPSRPDRTTVRRRLHSGRWRSVGQRHARPHATSRGGSAITLGKRDRPHRPPHALTRAAGSGVPLPQPSGHPWLVLAVLSIGLFMILLDGTIVSIAIPHIMETYDATLSSAEWVMNAYSLAFAVALVTLGRFRTYADEVHRRVQKPDRDRGVHRRFKRRGSDGCRHTRRLRGRRDRLFRHEPPGASTACRSPGRDARGTSGSG